MRVSIVAVTDFKSLKVLILLACLCLAADAQTGEWTWMGGSSALGSNGGQAGVYGTLGTPAAGNAPGGRYSAASWTDNSGNLWLFGGWGYDVNGNTGYLNDLWKFNPATSEWAWISGSSTVGGHGGQPGVYGTLGTPAAGNTPGGRDSAASWTDSSGNFWLFGGWDYDANSIAGELNDFWEFNPSNNLWAWMGGSSTVGPHDGQSGVYGTLGVPAAGNTPGGLYAPSNWTDASGYLWLFGGQGFDAHGNFSDLNGVWKFNPSSSEWAWMGGSRTVGSNGDLPGVYGTLGTQDIGNIPGNRSAATNWTDSSGNLWLFGGNGYDASGDGGYLNDLWKFNPAANEWAWMNGSSTVGSNGAQSGVYGTLGTLAAGNTPGGRSSASNWTDNSGNLWLFGGYGADAIGDGGYLSDFWEFNPPTNDWAWMGGSSTVGSAGGQSGVYGALSTPAAGNIPGGRDAASSWTDSNGNLWLFGGYGFDATGNYGPLNDLWEYQPPGASLSVAKPIFLPVEGTYTSAQSVTISDATAGATIYYTTNGATPTTSSTIYTAAILVSSSETLQAIATASGYSTSAVATAAYIIPLGTLPAPTPIFSPQEGIYTSAQSVNISDATAGATIYYTTNGDTPTTSSTIYTGGAITVSSTETLQAIATASGYFTSAVAVATFTINLPAPAFTIGGTAVTVAPGAVTGNASTNTVTPSGGFTGNVVLTAAITASPTGAQDMPILSFGSTTPVSITSASAGTATLTVYTIAPTTAVLSYPARPGTPWYAASGATLACILLIGIPARRRSWRTMLGMLVLLVVLAGGVLACGGSGSGGGASYPGTTPGTYTITVTGTSGTITATNTISLTVQ